MRVRTQRQNANRHTERGMLALDTSIQQDGWIGAITVAADGETFDGSARIETAGDALADAIIVRSDGSRPIVHVREDIATADDPKAVRLGLAANRIASLNLEWEPAVLSAIADQAIDVGALWTPEEWVVDAAPLALDQEPPAPPPAQNAAKSQFLIVVTCTDEADQTALFDQLTTEGYVCRLLLS